METSRDHARLRLRQILSRPDVGLEPETELARARKQSLGQGKNHVLLFPAPARLEPGRRRGIPVENVLAAYSDTTVAPHEYFDQTTLGPTLVGHDSAPCGEVGPAGSYAV